MAVSQKVAHLSQVATELGLPFGTRTMTYNSRLAQELGKWAEEKGRGDEFHDAAFRAYFADGQNIGSRDVLQDLARAVGLSGTDALRVLDEGTYRQAVDADWARSRQAGVTAVPTFMADGKTLVGAQPYEALERLVLGHTLGAPTL